CEILEPAFVQIENGTPLEDAPLRDKLTELTVLLSELHPADDTSRSDHSHERGNLKTRNFR
ncbi:hypothetical protein CWI49_01220, partial [Neisseria meningitidis]|uniref:hypothetical protein n=1 Tax=Neisseria meningitidis TaxID=487 RepID=UPI000CA7F559